MVYNPLNKIIYSFVNNRNNRNNRNNQNNQNNQNIMWYLDYVKIGIYPKNIGYVSKKKHISPFWSIKKTCQKPTFFIPETFISHTPKNRFPEFRG